jgi:hypothetical protein
MQSSPAGRLCALTGVVLVAPSLALAAALKPPPPPEYSSSIRQPALVAGRTVTFAYRVESADAFELTLTQQPSALRVVRVGSSPYRLVAGRPTWTLSLPGRAVTTRSVQIRVRLERGWAGRNVCLKLQESLAYGGVPDVFQQRSCGIVTRG